MDAPDIDPAELDHAMRHLEIVNRWLNGYRPSEAGLQRLIPAGAKEFTLLDVGCGSGDTLRQLAEWARSKKISARLTGIELSEQSTRRAAAACQNYPEIEIRHQDVFTLATDEQYDVVHSALVLHHFSRDEDVVRVLKRMNDAARLGVIINDLHRHPFAYNSIRLLTRALSRSEVLRNDAPLSVARAFTRDELMRFAEEANLGNVTVNWHWAFRWLMVSDKNPK